MGAHFAGGVWHLSYPPCDVLSRKRSSHCSSSVRIPFLWRLHQFPPCTCRWSHPSDSTPPSEPVAFPSTWRIYNPSICIWFPSTGVYNSSRVSLTASYFCTDIANGELKLLTIAFPFIESTESFPLSIYDS